MSLRSRHLSSPFQFFNLAVNVRDLKPSTDGSGPICNDRVWLGQIGPQPKQCDELSYYETFADLLINELGLEEEVD